jgi:uncharacterized protein YndB with AHSA1/START domain
MILVERTGRVAAPVEAVWDVVRRVEHLARWLAGVDRAEVVSGEGFGRRQLLHTADGSTFDAAVFAYREPTLLAWRERPVRPGARATGWTETHVELAPDGDNTAVRLIVVRLPAGPLSSALVRLGTHRIAVGLDRSIARLAELTATPTAETGAPRTATASRSRRRRLEPEDAERSHDGVRPIVARAPTAATDARSRRRRLEPEDAERSVGARRAKAAGLRRGRRASGASAS